MLWSGAQVLRLSHVTIGVPDLDAGITTYTNLGFSLARIGTHAIASTGREYLALEELPRDGIQRITLEGPPPSAALPNIEVIRHPERPSAARHPNGAVRLERLYIAVENLQNAVDAYRTALGLPEPKIERGTVIMADMAIFDVGPGLVLAHPYAPGACAAALESRGPGPFQLLYRTSSMDAAADWLSGHGLPPPVRGVRNTGEQAMLVAADCASGVCLGLVGMA